MYHRLMSHYSDRQSGEAAKPLLRGYSHAITAPLALLATVVLAVMAAGDTARQVTVLIYGATMVLLFSGSALYHVGNWSQSTREALRRLDHSNIFLLIAGTYTPIAFTVLAGWQRVVVLGAVWGFSLVGIAIAAGGVQVPRSVFVGLYLVVGWVALLAIPAILARVGPYLFRFDGTGLVPLASAQAAKLRAG